MSPLPLVVGALVALVALIALAALLRSGPLRWVALLASVALAALSARFTVAWVSQLAEGRTNTEGPGYGVMVLVTPIVLVGALLALGPLVLHLLLWRVLPAPAPPLTPLRRGAAWLLGVAIAAALVSALAPQLQGPEVLPLAGVAFTRGGDELLAWDAAGTVRSWKTGEQRVDARWDLGGGGIATPIAASPWDRWVVVPGRDKARLFALPDGGGAPTLLAEQRGDVWGFPSRGHAAVALGAMVTLFDPGSRAAPFTMTWRAHVTALAGGEDDSLLLADQEGVVSWVDLRTGEPRRSVRLPAAVVRLATFDGGRQALALTSDRAAFVVGGEPAVMRPLQRRRDNDPVATFTDHGLLVAFGPEVHRFDARTGQERPFFNHGQELEGLAGHPREERAAVILPGALWLVEAGATPNAPLLERQALSWR